MQPAFQIEPDGPPQQPRALPLANVGKLEAALVAKDLAAAADLFAALIPAMQDYHPLFYRILRLYAQNGESEAFIGLLLAHKALVFSGLSFIARTMELCGAERWLASFGPDLDAALARGEIDAIRFSQADLLRLAARFLPPALHGKLIELKWRGLTRSPGEPLFAVMDRETHRFSLSHAVRDYFFEKSRHQHLGRAEWERRVASACLVDHFTTDIGYLQNDAALARSFPGGRRKVYDSLFDAERSIPIYADLKASAPVLVSITHGSFQPAVLTGYAQFVRDGMKVVRDHNEALSDLHIPGGRPEGAMLMMRALEDGKVIMIAADGAIRQKATVVQLFDTPFELANGTPFVAYEASSQTGFLAAERVGDRLLPLWRPGPVRKDGEKLKQYTARWIAFIMTQIENEFRGPPESLVLRGSWASGLSHVAIQRYEKGRAPAIDQPEEV